MNLVFLPYTEEMIGPVSKLSQIVGGNSASTK